MSALGLRLATADDIAEGHAAAARLIGPGITSRAALERVQARSGCAIFAMRTRDGEFVGALSVIPLSAAALPILATGDFDGLEPPDQMVARPDEPAVAFYGWGLAGLTARARAAVIIGAVKMQREVYADLPFYARAATSEGERVLHDRLDARPLAGPGGLVSAPPWLAQAVSEVA